VLTDADFDESDWFRSTIYVWSIDFGFSMKTRVSLIFSGFYLPNLLLIFVSAASYSWPQGKGGRWRVFWVIL
jgi:hypothetical protein